MVSSFLSGVASGAAPAFARMQEADARKQEAEDGRKLNTLLLQSSEAYVAEKDRLLNLAGEEDWAPNKVDQQLDMLLKRSLDVSGLDDWRRQRLTNDLNTRNRAGKKGYRNGHEGKVDAVERAQYALQLTQGFHAIDDSARSGGAPADEFGGAAPQPFSISPADIMPQYADYLAGTLEELSADSSLEAQEKVLTRQLAAQKSIRVIHNAYRRDYIKHHNDLRDALITQTVEESRMRVENAVRDVFTHLNMPASEDDPAAKAAMDPGSIVAALDYDNIRQLAETRGKTYFDVVDKGGLQEVLGSLLAVKFLQTHRPEEADTDSVIWRTWVRELENTQNDSQLSAVFSDVLGSETAEFVKTNASQIINKARGAVDVQRPTQAILKQNYTRRETDAKANTNALLEEIETASLFGEEAAMFRQTLTAAFDPSVGDDGDMPWLDVLGGEIDELAARGVFGPQTEFGDQTIFNDNTTANTTKIYNYVSGRVAQTLNVLNQPGYATENLATLKEEDRNIILRDVVKQVEPKFNDQNNYFVQNDKLSDTARDALTRFAGTRGFVPPAYVDFVEREIESYRQQERAGEYRGDAQETADKARLNPVRMHLNGILNSKIFVALPINQRKKLNDLMDDLKEIRDPSASEAPRFDGTGAK